MVTKFPKFSQALAQDPTLSISYIFEDPSMAYTSQ